MNNVQNIEVMESDEFINRMNRRQELNRMSLSEKLTPKDIFEFSRDFFSSFFFVTIITLLKYNLNSVAYNIEFIYFFNSIQIIYIAFITRAFIRIILVYLNYIEEIYIKLFFNISDIILYVWYYAYLISGFTIYQNRLTDSFYTDLDNTTLIFSILLTGSITLSKDLLSIVMICICFPMIVMIFSIDPQKFYTTIGIDPIIIDNLPDFKANKDYLDLCNICQENITEGQEIIRLRCPGK